jgi:predicted ATPase
MPDVVLITDSGDDGASGGLLSLIDIAWQVFLYSQGRSAFTVIFDEPENHLHPYAKKSSA